MLRMATIFCVVEPTWLNCFLHKAMWENEDGWKSGATNTCPSASVYYNILQMKTFGSEMLNHFTWLLSTCLNYLGFLISNYTGQLNVTVNKKVMRLSWGIKNPAVKCSTNLVMKEKILDWHNLFSLHLAKFAVLI